MSAPRETIRYSIVMPLLNESEVLPALLARIDALAGFSDAPRRLALWPGAQYLTFGRR